MKLNEGGIFEIPEAKSRFCLVTDYTASHRTLRVLVHRTADHVYDGLWVVFAGVEYFAGSMDWTSAEFSLGNDEECAGMVRNIGIYSSSIPVADVVSRLKLFIVRNAMRHQDTALEVRILAFKGAVSEETIPRFAARRLGNQ